MRPICCSHCLIEVHKISENNWNRYHSRGTKPFFSLFLGNIKKFTQFAWIFAFCMICSIAPFITNILASESQIKMIKWCRHNDSFWTFRSACYAKWSDLRVLSRALPGHNLHHQAASKNLVLLLQPDSSLRAHRLHGCSWLHPPTWLGREAFLRWENPPMSIKRPNRPPILSL